MDKPSTFAKRLRELLDKTNMTQTELSKKTGISKSSITHYLKGDWEAKQDSVYSIAKATGISEAWIMGYDVPMYPLPDSLYQTAKDAVYNREFNQLTELEKIQALNSVRYSSEIHKALAQDGERSISDDDIKFALFGGDGEITDAMYEEVKRFAQMVKLREEAEKKKE